MLNVFERESFECVTAARGRPQHRMLDQAREVKVRDLVDLHAVALGRCIHVALERFEPGHQIHVVTLNVRDRSTAQVQRYERIFAA